MKKLFLSVLLIAISGFTMLRAEHIDANKARVVAQNFMSQQVGWQSGDLVNVSSQLPFNNFYTFVAAQGNGFVIVSADDRAIPILGYSVDSKLDPQYLPINTNEWLGIYEKEIAAIIANQAEPEAAVAGEWRRLENNEEQKPEDHLFPTAVAALMTTTWNQSSPYNGKCPSGTYTGCTATATAQVMKYHNHPTTGRGSHSYTTSTNHTSCSANFGSTTYDWNNMPNSLSSSSSTTQKNAVATLIYHVGVAAEMDYTSSGSGAATINYGDITYPSAENALISNFKYKCTLHSVSKSSYTDADWKTLLKDEIDASRPIIYTGYDTSAGHAFVCDGYDNSGRFHFNWGWGGSYDGYFAIGNLTPGGSGAGANATGSYNLSNAAIIGITPVTNTGSTSTITVSANNSSYGSVTGGGTYTNYSDTVTLLAKANEGYRFTKWSNGSISNPCYFIVNDNVTLTAQFERVTGDSLTYTLGGYQTSFGSSSSSTQTWGVRFPSSSLTANRKASKVRFYVSKAGTYTLSLYKGGTSSPTTQMVSGSVTISGSGGWVSVSLASNNIAIDATQPLWVVLSLTASGYPKAASYYGGNKDASWAKGSSSWYNLTTSGYYYSWMIALVNEYYAGGTTTDIAEAYLEGDYTVTTERGSINVNIEDASNQTIRLYDVMGRLLETQNTNIAKFAVTAGGTYLVQVGNQPAKKVVVLK